MRFKFLQSFIDILRGKRSNFFVMTKFNDIKIPRTLLFNINLNINGENNKIEISDFKSKHGKINITVIGNNNTIIIKEGLVLSDELNIIIGQNHPYFGMVNNSQLIIDNNTSIESLYYTTFNSNTSCKIGSGCMFAANVVIYNTDAHPIFDNETGKIINRVKDIIIGNHCWIGSKATILKNSFLPDNSILGLGSVYAGGAGNKPNCVYAGNPAKMVKQNVSWETNGAACGYIDNVY